MKRSPLRPVLILAAALIAVSACREKKQLPPEVIATVGPRQIVLDDFNRYLERNAGTDLSQTGAPAASALLDQYLEEILLSEYSVAQNGEIPADQIATAVRNDAGSRVVEKKDDLRRARLLADATAAAPQPTDAQIDAYYAQHQDEFRVGERAAVRQILVHDERLANQIARDLKAGASFEDLSTRFSTAPNSRTGGDIGFIGRGQLPRIFEDEIFRLQPGQISNVIRTSDSFHIFRVDDRRAAGILTRMEAEPIIRERLTDDAVRREVGRILDAARKKISLQVFPSRLPFPYSGGFASLQNE